MIENVDTENSHGAMVPYIKEIILMIADKDMERCIRIILLFIKENGIEECKQTELVLENKKINNKSYKVPKINGDVNK